MRKAVCLTLWAKQEEAMDSPGNGIVVYCNE